LTLQAITVTIWLASFLQLVIAAFIYIPLLCAIRGNLKEYCVHKIDKRIDEILKRKSRKRLQEARRQERERINNVDNGSEHSGARPTLPNIDVDLDSNVSYNKQQTFVAYRNGSVDQHSDYSSDHDQRYAPQYAQPKQHYNQQYSNVSYNPAYQGNAQQYYNDGHSRYSPNRFNAGAYNPSVTQHSQVYDSSQQYHRRYNAGYEATRPSQETMGSRSDSDMTSIPDAENKYYQQ
jgi:hypothetical protein